jgi:acetylglutamate/LysW-gamma-L-alpha-aminoadipate kinase
MNDFEHPIVVKIGGAAGVDVEPLCAEIAERWHAGERFVLVHGGSDATNLLAEQLGHPPRMVVSPSGHTSRYTDRRTLEIFAMATAGINRALVERLQGLGVPAWGLSGLDGRALRARRKAAIRVVEDGRVRLLRDDWTGTVESADGAVLRMLLGGVNGRGFLPVLAPLATGEHGEMLNVDGDRAAAVVAGALGAETLLLLSNVPGLLRDFPDPHSLIETIDLADLPRAMEYAQGRMKKKLLGAREALAQGVERVIIGDGRRQTPIGDALGGIGTTIGALVTASVS